MNLNLKRLAEDTPYLDWESSYREALVLGRICCQNINSKKLDTIPKGINNRFMVLQLNLTEDRHATVISAYDKLK